MKWYHWLLLPIALPYVCYLSLSGKYNDEVEDSSSFGVNENIRAREHVCAVLKRDDGSKRVIESGRL